MPSNKNAQAIMATIATDRSKVLGVVIGDRKIEPPGLYIPRRFAVPNPSARYIVVSMDFDVPYLSRPLFGLVLHWIQANLVPAPTQTTTDSCPSVEGATVVTLKVDEGSAAAGCIARHLSPNPPPGSAPHRYGFYLYEQPPDGFDAARWAPDERGNMGNWARKRFGLDGWEKAAGLGPILAANYFTSN